MVELIFNEYIVSVEDDGYCKMVRITITESGGNCEFKVVEAGFVQLGFVQLGVPIIFNCNTFASNWNARRFASIAKTNSQRSYGIGRLEYTNLCLV